jgi:hypothetical protein
VNFHLTRDRIRFAHHLRPAIDLARRERGELGRAAGAAETSTAIMGTRPATPSVMRLGMMLPAVPEA